MTFNGEIFNYKELRESLEYPFITDGDTETLLALWIKHGATGLKQVRGQFAFIIWDSERKEISMAVDAMGILPLYISYHDARLVAASSAASISALSVPRVHPETLIKLITRRSVAAPETPWLGIQRIPPGEVWTVTAGEVRKLRWIPPVAGRATSKEIRSPRRLAVVLRTAASRAVTSDVEVGIFLSGGLDSALVAGLAKEQVSYPLRAYTAVWSDKSLPSEEVNAKRTAEALGLRHTLIEVSASDWWRAMELGTRMRDAPLAEPADAVFFLLAQRASEDLKVVLTGEGADELFGGYPKYRLEALAAVPGVATAARQLSKFPAVNARQKIRRAAAAIAQPEASKRFEQYFGTGLGKWVQAGLTETRVTMQSGGVSSLRCWDIENYLAPVLLDRADRMAMAHSLEVRPLFLDADVVDFALSVASPQLLSLFGTKRILRKAARHILPRDITHTRKRGFPMPLGHWIRTELRDRVEAQLAKELPLIDTHVDPKVRRELFTSHVSKNKDHSLELFMLLSLSLWIEGMT